MKRTKLVLVSVVFTHYLASTPAGEDVAAQTLMLRQEATDVGKLTLQKPLFWGGTDKEMLQGASAGYNSTYRLSLFLVETCGAPDNPDPCWAYKFYVAESGDLLRVGIDLNRRGDCYDFEVFPPGTYESGGRPTLDASGRDNIQCPEVVPVHPDLWNWEVRITDPAVGWWTVRIVPYFVEDWRFRLRAKLENTLAGSTDVVLPDLRPHPPYEFTWTAPASPVAGSLPDKLNPAGPAGISCTPDEIAEAGEQGQQLERCLRFSTGIYNIGPGPIYLHLKNPELQDTELNDTDIRSPIGGPVEQRIFRADGTVVETKAAGEWKFHATHNHNHLEGIVAYELLRVENSPASADPHKKRLVPVSSGQKVGWHIGDQRLVDWQRFNHGRQFQFAPPGGGGECASGERCLAQSQGWGDAYRWQRPTNFVPFPVTTDGTPVSGDYILRMSVDRLGQLTEAATANNTAYAWIRVEGERVDICGRGYGPHPWAPSPGGSKAFTPSFWLGGQVGTDIDSPTVACK